MLAVCAIQQNEIITNMAMNKLTRSLFGNRIWRFAFNSKIIRNLCSHGPEDGTHDFESMSQSQSQNLDGSMPFIYSSVGKSNIDIRSIVERPFLFYTKRKKRRSKFGKKRKLMVNGEIEGTETLEAKKDEQHPTIKLVFNLLNSGCEENAENKKLKKKDWKNKPMELLASHYTKNNAHLLGLSQAELNSRHEFLTKLGLTKFESLSVALNFPTSLTLESKNIEDLARLFNCYKIHLGNLFMLHPFVFGLSYEDVSKKIDHLGSLGLKKKEVGDLISSNPLVLCFSLNECAKETLKFIMGLSGWRSSPGKSQFIESILKTSFQEKAVKYEFNEMFESITSFLEQLEVPVSDIFKICPEFFSIELDCLYRTMHYLIEAPFFFDIEALKGFIHKYPDLYLQFDKKEIRQKVHHIFKLLDEDPELYQIMQASPRLFIHSISLEDCINLFLEWNFTKKHVVLLLKKSPLLFHENRLVENMKERLEFLLKGQDLFVEDIMKFPSCLQIHLMILKCRIGYIRKVKPGAFKAAHLQTIFTMQDEEFAEKVCSTSLDEFNSYVESNFSPVEANLFKKKDPTKKQKKITKALSQL